MNFGFPLNSPFQPFCNPVPPFGTRNSFTGFMPPPPGPFNGPFFPPANSFQNLRASFGMNLRKSQEGQLKASFHKNGEEIANTFQYPGLPTYYGAPIASPFTNFNANPSFGPSGRNFPTQNSHPQYQSEPYPFYSVSGNNSNFGSANGRTHNHSKPIKTEANEYSNETNLNQLIAYQEELKSVKNKIDAMYEKALQRSQQSIQMQQKNLESIKGSQALIFKEYKDSSSKAQHFSHSSEKKAIEVVNFEENLEFEEELYEGDRIGNIKHGSGRLVYPNGLVYTGNWENNKKHGFGILTNVEGDQIYAGDWKLDVFDGQGIIYNIDSKAISPPEINYQDLNCAWSFWYSYEGDFKEGQMCGMGVLALRNGEKYNGKFKDGMIHGEGSYHMSNGETVLGEWAENVLIRQL